MGPIQGQQAVAGMVAIQVSPGGSQMIGSRTRVGNLGRVFAEGRSELLVCVGRLCILYEDLRLALEELRLLRDKERAGLSGSDHFRTTYFLRNSLVTLVEFTSALNRLCATTEFKHATIASSDRQHVVDAEAVLQRHRERFKELRNEFDGHMKEAAIRFAIEHASDVTGTITWRPNEEAWSAWLECGFAGHLVAGVISSKVTPGADAKEEIRQAFTMMSEGFTSAQEAVVALVHAFLWDRFV